MKNIIEIYKLIKPKFKNKFWFLFVLTLIGSFFEIIGISLIIPLFLFIFSSNGEEYIFNVDKESAYSQVFIFINDFINITNLNNLLISIVFLIAFKSVFLTFISWLNINLVFSVKKYFSGKILQHYIKQSQLFYILNNSSDLYKNITSEVLHLVAALRSAIFLMIEAVTSIVICGYLFYIEPKGSVYILIIIFIIALSYLAFIKKKVTQWGIDRKFYEEKRVKNILEGIYGQKELKIYGKIENHMSNFFYNTERFLRAHKLNAFIELLPRLWIEFVAIIILLIIILNSSTKENTIIIISAFGFAGIRLLPSLTRLISFWNELKFFSPAVYTIKKIQEEISNSNQNYIDQNKKIENWKSIKVKDLNYIYPDNTKALENINLEIKNGDIVGIFGKSGSGKTTFVNTITGLLPVKNSIYVDGVDISKNSLSWIKNIGYVSQHIYLFDNTIEYNITLSKKNEINYDLLKEAIKVSMLDDFINSLTNKLETQIGENAIKVSGGQKQRISIARAIYHNPSLLVFDEFTSALDNETEKLIVEQIIKPKKNRTIIIISHKISSLKNCDYIIEFKNKKVEKIIEEKK